MYKDKVIAIIGPNTIIGRIILAKFTTTLIGAKKIYVLTKKKESNGGKEVRVATRHPKDLYLKLLETSGRQGGEALVVERVYTEGRDGLGFAEALGVVDYFFNCNVPCEPFHLEQVLARHVLWTCKFVNYLNKQHPNATLITLASIYSQPPGYVSQTIDPIPQQSPFSFKSIQQLSKYLTSRSKSQYVQWQLSLSLLQKAYLQSNLANLHLIRIPIVGACAQRPKGYIDRFNSVSFLMYEVGLGKITQLKGKNGNIIDMVPADYVGNFMLSVGWFAKEHRQIYNLSTASLNPLRVGRFIEVLEQYWNHNPPKERKMGDRVSVRIYETESTFGIMRLKNRIPNFLIEKTADIFDLKAKKIELAKDKIKSKRQQQIAQKYSYFLNNEWICSANKCIDLHNRMSVQDRKNLPFNLNLIDWTHYLKLYLFGIQKYILGHTVQHYSASDLDMLEGNNNMAYFSDVYWALSVGKPYKAKSSAEMKKFVMSSDSVRKEIRNLIEARITKLGNSPTAYGQVEEEYEKVANAMCDRMFSEYKMGSIRFLAWFMHKVFKKIYEQVVIDKQAFLKLKSYQDRGEGPIILLPTHRSYIDFIILSYIFFGYGIQCPYIASAQDFLNMAIIHILLRKSGAFFIRRDMQQNRLLYKAIMTEYVQKILSDKCNLEFFIEGTRSRVGKMLDPKYGILTMVVDAVNANMLKDAKLVPITINYEKVLEGDTFPIELLGESKVKESLGRLIKAVEVLKENYGRIYIEICEPISLRKYLSEGVRRKKPMKDIIYNLGYEIVYTLSDNLVVMPSAIVASIVLMQRRGISEQQLNVYVQWFCRQVHSRGIKIARTQITSSISVTSALNFLGDIVQKTKKNVFQLDLSLNHQTINIFLLSYYRNTITHIFFLQAIILTALNSFGYDAAFKDGVNADRVKDQVVFLYTLIGREYVLRDSFGDGDALDRYVETLVVKNILLREGGNGGNLLKANEKQSIYFSFLCSLVWPLVESYWLTTLYLFNLDKLKTSIPVAKIVGQIQWFGEEMIQQRVIEHYQAVSQDTLKNAINSLSRMGIVQIIKEEVQQVIVSSVKLNVSIEKLKQVELHISNFLKSRFAKSVKGLVDPTRSSVMLDFPFLAKL